MTALLAIGFGAGLLAPVNPCGFALLPAYLATFLHDTTPGTVGQRIRGALRTGTSIALGFAGTLTLIAAALAFGLRALIGVIPWLAAAVGVVLVLAGLLMLAGRGIQLPKFGAAASNLARGHRMRLVGFGAGYGLASASCTLGILLAVVAQALTAQTTAAAVGVFAAYALGSTVLLLALAVAAATAHTALARVIGRLARHLPRIAGGLLTASGLYLLIYWAPTLLTSGSATPGDNALTRLAAHTTTWIATHQTLVVTAALAVIGAGILTATVARRRSRRGKSSPVECCPADTEQPSTEHHAR